MEAEQTPAQIMATRHTKMRNNVVKMGVMVVPVFEAKEIPQLRAYIENVVNDYPEIDHEKLNDENKGLKGKYVLGGFGAHGNPGSFHHEILRDLRAQIKRKVGENLVKAGVCNSKMPMIEMLFDRLCVRRAEFGTPGAEGFHTDSFDPKLATAVTGIRHEEPRAASVVYGGWVNFDANNQYCSAIVGEVRTDMQKGFKKAKQSAQEKRDENNVYQKRCSKLMAAQAGLTFGAGVKCGKKTGKIIVPPGHCILIQHGLVHAIHAVETEKDETSLRLFCGWRVTKDTQSMIINAKVFLEMGVPILPSGQLPPMYAVMHKNTLIPRELNEAVSPDKAGKKRPKKAVVESCARWARKYFKHQALRKMRTNNGMKYYLPGANKESVPSPRDCPLLGLDYEEVKADRERLNKYRAMPSLLAMRFLKSSVDKSLPGYAPYKLKEMNIFTPELYYLATGESDDDDDWSTDSECKPKKPSAAKEQQPPVKTEVVQVESESDEDGSDDNDDDDDEKAQVEAAQEALIAKYVGKGAKSYMHNDPQPKPEETQKVGVVKQKEESDSEDAEEKDGGEGEEEEEEDDDESSSGSDSESDSGSGDTETEDEKPIKKTKKNQA